MNPIVFYDGECGLCNYWVQWILNRDSERIFRFAALQSSFSQELFTALNRELTMQSLVVLKEDGEFIDRSRAVAYLFSKLRRRSVFYWLLLITPRFIADIGYSGVAAVRKVLQRNKCRLFTIEERTFFLNDADFTEWTLNNIFSKKIN